MVICPKKENQRWLWHAVDHNTNTVTAFVLGKRTDETFKELQSLLEPVLQMTFEHDLTAILRIKNGKMKYRLPDYTECHAAEIFMTQVKDKWQKLAGLRYQTKSVVVELNLAQTAKEKAQWVKVKLFFCRGVNPEKNKASKHDWALVRQAKLDASCRVQVPVG